MAIKTQIPVQEINKQEFFNGLESLFRSGKKIKGQNKLHETRSRAWEIEDYLRSKYNFSKSYQNPLKYYKQGDHYFFKIREDIFNFPAL